MIHVTKPHLPSRSQLDKYIDGIYQREWLTNKGPLVEELTKRLSDRLGVENLLLVANGTLALQVAYRALGVSGISGGNAITTPFTFPATPGSLKWEGIDPVFADIDPKTWCLDPTEAEKKITASTEAIVPVHVFGNACDISAFDALAKSHEIKLIFDAAHCFDTQYENQSILSFGDASTLSFHATKLFHSIEGGAIVFKSSEHLQVAEKLINFGLAGPNQLGGMGINAKMNEFQAAMGLAVLDEFELVSDSRKQIWSLYLDELGNLFHTQQWHPNVTNNHSYFPILLSNESQLLTTMEELASAGISTRRYFRPSLDTLEIYPSSPCPVSRDIASRVLCLPIYSTLALADVSKICALIRKSLTG